MQYIFERTFPDTNFIFGFEDVQSRLTYDLTPRNTITLYVLESYSSLDRHTNLAKLGVNALVTASYHYTLGNFGWRYTPSQKLMVSTHAAWMRERYDNNNPGKLPLGAGYYGEWVGNATATWMGGSPFCLVIDWQIFTQISYRHGLFQDRIPTKSGTSPEDIVWSPYIAHSRSEKPYR